jgi:hypothetical protein
MMAAACGGFAHVEGGKGEAMRRSLRVGLLLIAMMAYGACFTSAQSQEKNPRVQLVSEFIRELEILYRLQETAKKEVAENNSTAGQLTTGIRVGTRTLFEMDDSVRRLDMIAVDGQWAKFRDLLKQLHTHRIAVMQEMTQMAKTMLSEPKPGVDYGAMAAHAPELTAQVEQIDKSMFDIAQAFFFALVDERRVGADGNLHHLLLTKKDRAAMVELIDKIFGPTLEDKNATNIVSAAWVIKYGLKGPNYKSADEP